MVKVFNGVSKGQKFAQSGHTEGEWGKKGFFKRALLNIAFFWQDCHSEMFFLLFRCEASFGIFSRIDKEGIRQSPPSKFPEFFYQQIFRIKLKFAQAESSKIICWAFNKIERQIR